MRSHRSRGCPPTHPPTPPGDTLPGVVLCPVSGASPLPGCSQVVLLASSLWRQEGRIIHFRFPTTANAKRAETTGAAVHGGGNYLMKKRRPSRVSP